MKPQDESLANLADAVTRVLLGEKKNTKETKVQDSDKDFVDLHAIDVEEANEFTKAAAKAAVAGDDEFEFEGKTFPAEMGLDVAKKILGESSEIEEAFMRLPGNIINSELYVASKALADLLKNQTAGNDFDAKHLNTIIKSLNDVKKSAKKFNKPEEVPISFQYKKESIDVEESNEFTKAAAKAAVAGDDEFEFEGKTFPTEMDVDVAKKILGEATSDAQLLVKDLEMLIKNPDPGRFKQYGGKDKYVQMLKVKLAKLQEDGIDEAVEANEDTLTEAAKMSSGVKTAQKQIYSLSESLKVGSNLNKGVNKSLDGKYDGDFKNMEKAISQVHTIWEDIEYDYKNMGFGESSDLDEAVVSLDRKALARQKALFKWEDVNSALDGAGVNPAGIKKVHSSLKGKEQ